MALARLLLVFLLSCASLAALADNRRFLIEKKIAKLEALVTQRYGRDHRALELWLRDRKKKMPRVSPQLLKAYYFLGSFYSQLYLKHHTGEETAEDVTNFRRARYYLGAAEAFEVNIDKTEERLALVESARKERLKARNHTSWRVLVNYLSYQELALLKDAGGEEKISSPQRGFCAGGTVAWGNYESEWALDACAFVTSGNVGAKNTARYFQQDVSSKGLYFKPTYWWLFSEKEAGLGIGVPVLLRTVDYTEPSGVTVQSRRAVPFGVSVDGRWQLAKKTQLLTSMGQVDGSLLWTIGASYQLD